MLIHDYGLRICGNELFDRHFHNHMTVIAKITFPN